MLRLGLVFFLAACFQLLGLTFSSSSQSQQQQNTKSDIQIQEDLVLDRIMDRLIGELGLSFVQQKQVRAIYESTNSRRILDKSIRKGFEDYSSELNKVLTPEQWKKFYKPLPPEGTPMAPASGSLKEKMFEHLTNELKLSSDQLTKVRTLYETLLQKCHMALEQSNSLDYLRKLDDERTAEIKKILTPEQQKKFEAMGKKGKNNTPPQNILLPKS